MKKTGVFFSVLFILFLSFTAECSSGSSSSSGGGTTTTTTGVTGTWKGNHTSFTSNPTKYNWTFTVTLNSDLTWSSTDISSDGGGSCTESGTYSYTSTTLTGTVKSITNIAPATCDKVGSVNTVSYTISGSGVGSTMVWSFSPYTLTLTKQ